MKKIITLLSLVTILIAGSSSNVKASHATGADLTYTYVSPNVVHLVLRFYRDCSGINAPTSETINISSAACGQAPFTVTLPVVSAVEIVTSDCIDTTSATTCNGGTRYGVEEYIYAADITLPAACSDWLFEFEECCRNTSNTLNNSQGQSLYVSTNLDNLSTPTNSSPHFLSYPVTSFCVGNPFYYKQEAFDPDGDSLVYSLVDAQGGGGATLLYNAPYSGSYPIASSTPITIDQTGQITFTPSAIQTAVLCVLVEEFRNGIKIGSVKRDIQIKVEVLCDTNLIPNYTSIAITNGITVGCGVKEFNIPFKQDVQCGSIVNDDFRIINALGTPIPIVSITGYNCFGGLTDSVHVIMSEPFTYGKNYVWTKTGSDGNTILGKCGFGSFTFDTITYNVVDSSAWVVSHDSVGCILNNFTVTLSDSVYCFTVDLDGSSLSLIDAGNGSVAFPITNTYPYCGPTGEGQTKQILIELASQQTPAGPLYLIAHTGNDGNTIANSCGRYFNDGDTIARFDINTVIPLTLGSDIDACTNTNEIPVTLNSGLTAVSPLTFQWYLNGSPISSASNPTYTVTTNSGVYGVVASATAFCRGSDSVNVNIMNTPAPNFGSDRNLCIGDSIVLDMSTTGGNIFQWYVNNVAANQDTLPSYTITTNAQYIGASIAIAPSGHLCFGSDTIVVLTWPYPTTSLTNQTVCSNTLPFVIDAGNPGASYLWSTGNAADTLRTLSTSTAGTYNVTITNFPGCAVKDSMSLTVNISPTASLTPSYTQCDNISMPTLDPGFAGASSYTWTVSGNPTPVGSSQQYTPPATIGTNTYTIVVSNGTCTASAQSVITVNAVPVFNALGTQTICEIDPAVVLDANFTGANVSYLWSNGATTQTISTNAANSYTVTVTDNNCTASSSVTLTVDKQLFAPVLACGASSSASYKIVYTWNDIPGNTGYEVSFDGNNWIPANTPVSATSHGTNTVSPTFFVHALMSGACKYGKRSDPVTCAVIIPNILTLNNDNVNEVFIIDNIGFYPDNTFKIFNRWGKEVYSESGYNNTTKVFKGGDLPTGSYFYILDLGNGAAPTSGTITISR